MGSMVPQLFSGMYYNETKYAKEVTVKVVLEGYHRYFLGVKVKTVMPVQIIHTLDMGTIGTVQISCQ